MTTYRILEAMEDTAGVERYWVFAVTRGTCHCLASNRKRKDALRRVFHAVQDDDIVESIRGSEVLHEEFGSDFKARLAAHFSPKA